MFKKVVKKCESILAESALKVTKSAVNSPCVFALYEPGLPKGAERLKKIKNR